MNERMMGMGLLVAAASLAATAPIVSLPGERRSRGGKRLDRDLNPASQFKPKSESLSRILGKAKRGGRV